MAIFNEILERLNGRLPELEWMLKTRQVIIQKKQLPKGLFRDYFEPSLQSCLREIREDMNTLKHHTDERSGQFLANKILDKINVLVGIYRQKEEPPPSSKSSVHFGLRTLNTRQQWVQTLSTEIAALNAQKAAIAKTLKERTTQGDLQTALLLQGELGEIERLLTLAQETLNRADNYRLI